VPLQAIFHFPLEPTEPLHPRFRRSVELGDEMSSRNEDRRTRERATGAQPSDTRAAHYEGQARVRFSWAYPSLGSCTSDIPWASRPSPEVATRGRTGNGTPSTLRTRALSSAWTWLSLPPSSLLLVYTITSDIARAPAYTTSRYYWVCQW